MKADLNRLIELQRLLLSFSQVDRSVHRKHAGKFVQENDAEHSYNLAMTGWYLTQWFPELDRDLVICYALVHDLIEVYAGDTYIYGEKEKIDSKEQREAEAAHRLKQEWGDFDAMNATIEKYEHKADRESQFVYALDKIMPIMLVYINDGYSWEAAKVTVDMLYQAKKDKVALSPEIVPYFEELHELLLASPGVIRPI